jgi:hypothetical protein
VHSAAHGGYSQTRRRKGTVEDVLKIAKVYRNKEAHIVTLTHRYVPAEYRKIESALTLLYHHAFNQKLELHFSIATGGKPLFRVT